MAYSAATSLAQWRKRWPWITTAINLSPRQFHQRDLAERFGAIFASATCPASAIAVEITETMTLSEASSAVEAVAALKRLGAHVAIDDFGTGHSSLTHLRRFAVDHLKIDRSFVSGIGKSAQDETLIRTIVTLGHSLGLTLIAEGVETQEQLEFLESLDCDLLQGYLFSPPIPHEQAEQMLRSSGSPEQSGEEDR